MLRPFPTGFICRPAERHSADFDKFEPSFLKSANLIGFVESLNQEVNVIRNHETNFGWRLFCVQSLLAAFGLKRAKGSEDSHRVWLKR
jgi:hypothetical protein